MFMAEHMSVSSSETSCITESYTCSKQKTSEKTSECGDTSIVVLCCGADDALQLSPEDATKESLTEYLDLPSENPHKSSLTDKSSSPELTRTESNLGSVSEDTHNKLGIINSQKAPSKENDSPGSGILQNDTAPSSYTVSETLQSSPQNVAKSFMTVDSELPCENASSHHQIEKSSFLQQSMSNQTPQFHSDSARGEPLAVLGTPHDVGDKRWKHEESVKPSRDAVANLCHLGCRIKTTAKSRKKCTPKSLRRSDRVSRSRSQEKSKASESSANQPNVSINIENTRKRKKKRRGKRIEADEYAKIRANLRYLVNRISYEQSLITAYSSEGWKGLSLEKLKPEKELQRATTEIFRRKSKIRDLFQRIDSLCAEGSFPESLFDSDGQISSEDIFCAKCGSKDLTADNDIILCDGACDRGFHQLCLVPPLLKDDIPPDDEGWLCPGCDCKVDCIDLLNMTQGTHISISDSWEKVFPEATAAGQDPNHTFGLPSDDSDDNDFDPSNPEVDEESQEDESSSDDFDFTSELEAPPGDKQLSGLSSEDSEDGDYDPGAPELDENVRGESSSSDFSSDFEDLGATLGSNEFVVEREKSKNGRKKEQALNGELLPILEPSQDESVPISGKRNVERLDYKKLYDETYGNVSSDSSDDEDFTDAVVSVKRRKSTEPASASANGNSPVTKKENQPLKNTPKGKCRRFSARNTSISPSKAHEGSSPSSSGGKPVRPSGYRKLGEATTRGLYKSFEENKYPDRAKKDNLAKQLGITFQQVSKWFENVRHSFNHSSSMDASIAGKTAANNSPVPKTITKRLVAANCNGSQVEEIPKIGDNLLENHIQDGTKGEIVLGIRNTSTSDSKTPKPGKRKHNSDDQVSDLASTKEKAKTPPVDSPKAQKTRSGGRVTRSQSVA